MIRLTFDCAITAAPVAGEVEIRRLLPGGLVDETTDLSSQFTFSVDPAPDDNVLRIAENGRVLNPDYNETWIGILNRGGWAGVADFKVDYVVICGDQNGDFSTDVLDAGRIVGMRGTTPVPDCSRYDIDGNGSIDVNDAGKAVGCRGSGDPGKPSGHTCNP